MPSIGAEMYCDTVSTGPLANRSGYQDIGLSVWRVYRVDVADLSKRRNMVDINTQSDHKSVSVDGNANNAISANIANIDLLSFAPFR
jgi:GTP:adenosylcobinamide-phosphate guanylyltransferase